MDYFQDVSEIAEIWETENEKKLSVSELKKKYYLYAHNHFVCKPPVIVINKETGWSIELSRRVVAEWRIKTRTRERILAIKLLVPMIEKAAFVKTDIDHKKTKGIESVSYFENHCKINGQLFKINIVIKKQSYHNRYFVYYFSATKY